MKQTCILILGMHRSGTSALTGVLSILDIYLGSDLMPASQDNEKGYYENNNLYRINEKLLAQIGSSWEDIFFVEDKLKGLVEIQELKEQIKKEFEYSKTFAIKDPRLAFLFPVYKKVLEELGIKIKVIIPYRNPIEVASSLNKRDNFIFENAMLLWAYHMLLAEKFSRGYKRVFIEFDELMSEQKKTIKLISEKLNIHLNSKYTKKRKKIEEFLEPNLKHHNISINNLSNNIPKIVQDILSFRKIYNEDNIIKNFEHLRVELFDYQKLFYNQSIVKTFSTLKQTQLAINEKDNLLTQSNQALEETKTGLSQSTQTIEQQQQALAQAQQALKAKDTLLTQNNQALEETKTGLSQSTQTIELQQQALAQAQQTLSEKEKLFQLKHKELEEIKNQVELLKDELVVIYTGRGCKITRFIKRIKGHFE